MILKASQLFPEDVLYGFGEKGYQNIHILPFLFQRQQFYVTPHNLPVLLQNPAVPFF